MANDLTPAYIKLRYGQGTHQHVQTIGTKPFGTLTPGEDSALLSHGGLSIPFSTAIAAYVAVIAPLFNTGVQFGIAELWSKPTVDAVPEFITAVNVNDTGDSDVATVVASEQVMSWRTSHRGGFKLYFMEGIRGVNAKDYAPYTGDPVLIAINSYIIGDDCVFYARNNDKPLVPIAWTSKINDVLRDKYLIGS